MLSALATLLITSTVVPTDELALTPWPHGMQAVVRDDGWTCTPPATSDALHKRMEEIDRWPQLCREIGDTRVKTAVTIRDQLHEVDLAQHATHEQQLEQNQATTWLKLKVFGGGVGVGIVAAIVYGLVHK